MAKKKKGATRSAPPPKKHTFDIEQSPWFAPGAFVLIFLALVILFREFIFSDKMLYGSDMIQAGIFFRSFLVDFFHEHGAIPRWNPYIFGGMPFIEAFHGDIFYPLSILKFFGNIYRMLGYTQFIHVFLAGVFMYLCARQFRLSKIAALLSAVCYMFAPSFVSFVAPGHDGKIFVTALFPLTMLFLDRGFQKNAFLNFTLMGLVVGVIIVSPHAQMSYFTLWALAAYTIYRLVFLFREKRSLMPLVKPGVLALYAVVVGLLLSAIQFYPGYIYTSDFSPRADTKRGWEWATSWSLHEEEAMSLLIPEFAGVSTQNAETYYWGKNAFKDNSEAVGAVTFFLALLGAFFARRRSAYFFTGLAVFALLYALADTTPVFRLFYHLIPKVQSLRAPSMIMFLFTFSVAMLAGMGLQRLRDAAERSGEERVEAPGPRFDYLLWGLPAFLLLLALLFSAAGRGMLDLWTSLFYSEAATIQIQRGVTKMTIAYANLPAIQSGAWFAFLFSTLAAACLWLYRTRKAGAVILALLMLVPLIDGLRFNNRFISTYDQNRTWSPNALTEFFTNRDDYYRVRNFGVMPEDLLPYHGVPVMIGYHGNQLRWYDDLIGGPQQSNYNNPYVINLSGCRYLLTPANQQLPGGYFGEKPVTTAATFGSVTILQNENALPRAYLVDRYRVFEDRQDIYPEIIDGGEDLRHMVFLEEEPDLAIEVDSLAQDSVWFLEYQPDTVTLGVSVAKNKLLVLTDNWYDAWEVYLDGRPAPVLRAYGTFRAVPIPAGTTGAQFVFKSERYRLGKLITWLTLIYIVLVLIVGIIQARRQKPEAAVL